MVDAGASLRRVLLGSNLGAAAAKNGWAVAVIDGSVRDVTELAQCSTGIPALSAMPLPTEKRSQGQPDVAVQIQGEWGPLVTGLMLSPTAWWSRLRPW